jgi:CBS domain-containing protein
MQARDIMNSPAVTVTTETTVKYAAKLLASNGFTTLPVLDGDGRLIGILTEADVMRGRFPRDPRYHHAFDGDILGADETPQVPAVAVDAVMTTPAIGMGAGADVVDVVTAMLSACVRSMPIVDGSRVVGIVTRRDLMRALVRDDDRTIAADVRHRLAMYGGPDRWTVDVHDGAVAIGDEFDNATDQHVAEVLTEAGATVHAASQAANDPIRCQRDFGPARRRPSHVGRRAP